MCFRLNKMAKKRGANKLITVYWFFIITLVAGGIVLMANAYYGRPYDVRGMEATILADHVSNCIYPGGKANPSLIASDGVFKSEFKDNFMKRCSLNFDTNREFVHEQYYVSAQFYSSPDSENSIFNLTAGNQNFIPDCEIKNGGSNLATCKNESMWMYAPGQNTYYVKILSIVGNTNKNAK